MKNKLILSQMVQFDVSPDHWLVLVFLRTFNIDGRLPLAVMSSVFI